MKDCYELKGTRLKSNYAQRMRNGYSVNINCETPDEAKEYAQSNEFLRLLSQEGLKSVSLTIKSNGNHANEGITA